MSGYLTPDQAAELRPFGNADWYREQLRLGKLHGSKIGGRWWAVGERGAEAVRLQDAVRVGPAPTVDPSARVGPTFPPSKVEGKVGV